MVNLFVRGLPYDTEELHLIELFSIYGLVNSVYIPIDKVTGKKLNYGFIELTDQGGADRAIVAIDGSEFRGGKISVRIAEKKEKVSNEKIAKPNQDSKGRASSETVSRTEFKTSSIVIAVLCVIFLVGNAKAQSLPADTTFSGLYNAIKSEIDPNRMEVLLKLMENKPEASGSYESLIDATRVIIAAAFAESGNRSKATDMMNKIEGNASKNTAIFSVVRRLIDKGMLEDAEAIIKSLNGNLGSQSKITDPIKANFTSEEKRRLDFQYGVLLFKRGKYLDALKFLSPASEKERYSAADDGLYALALIRTGKSEEALKEVNKLVRKPVYWNAEFRNGAKELFSKVYGNDNRYKSLMDSVDADLAKRMQAKVTKMALNEPAPDFELRDLNGKVVSLKSLKGKTVFIDFWATWCQPCVASFPGMQKAVNYYKKDTSVVFMFVHSYEKKGAEAAKDAKKMITGENYNFDVFMDLKNKETGKSEVAESFKITGLPTKLVIDKNGVIRFRTTGFMGLDDAVPEIRMMIDMSRI